MSTIHNPINFDPADYEVVDYLDNKRPPYFRGMPSEAYALEVQAWEADMARVLGADWRVKSHHCIHCGNGNVRWITAVRHLPTNDIVVFGSDCTERLDFTNKVSFRLALIQSRADARTERFKVFQHRAEFLEQHPELVTVYTDIDAPVHAKNYFVRDVLSKLDKYGSLSVKQVNAIVESLKRDVDNDARRAAEAAEPKGDAPTGRVAVTGIVLSTKEQESDFGITLKMLVKLENNSKVWCTVPSRETIERGDHITVKATWTPSPTDRSFAFGKRPVLVSRTPANVVAA